MLGPKSGLAYLGEGEFSAEKLVLDVLREQEGPLVALLVRDEVHDKHEDEVDDALFDDGVHLDLFEADFSRFLQRLRVGSIHGRLRRSTLLQDFCRRRNMTKSAETQSIIFLFGHLFLLFTVIIYYDFFWKICICHYQSVLQYNSFIEKELLPEE